MASALAHAAAHSLALMRRRMASQRSEASFGAAALAGGALHWIASLRRLALWALRFLV